MLPPAAPPAERTLVGPRKQMDVLAKHLVQQDTVEDGKPQGERAGNSESTAFLNCCWRKRMRVDAGCSCRVKPPEGAPVGRRRGSVYVQPASHRQSRGFLWDRGSLKS